MSTTHSKPHTRWPKLCHVEIENDNLTDINSALRSHFPSNHRIKHHSLNRTSRLDPDSGQSIYLLFVHSNSSRSVYSFLSLLLCPCICAYVHFNRTRGLVKFVTVPQVNGGCTPSKQFPSFTSSNPTSSPTHAIGGVSSLRLQVSTPVMVDELSTNWLTRTFASECSICLQLFYRSWVHLWLS